MSCVVLIVQISNTEARLNTHISLTLLMLLFCYLDLLAIVNKDFD